MPTDLFTLSGTWGTAPQAGGLLKSGASPVGPTPLSEQVTLDQKQLVGYALAADAPQVVAFGGVVNAHVVTIEADRKVKATITSADGATQVVPVDGTLVLISRTVPITAISLTRVAGQLTNVSVFLGEKA